MHQAEEPVEFEAFHAAEAHTLVNQAHVVDPELALAILSQNMNVQKATGLDAASVLARLSGPWSAERAVRECESLYPSDKRVPYTHSLSTFSH